MEGGREGEREGVEGGRGEGGRGREGVEGGRGRGEGGREEELTTREDSFYSSPW